MSTKLVVVYIQCVCARGCYTVRVYICVHMCVCVCVCLCACECACTCVYTCCVVMGTLSLNRPSLVGGRGDGVVSYSSILGELDMPLFHILVALSHHISL